MNRIFYVRFAILFIVSISLSITSIFAQQDLPDDLEVWIEAGRKDWEIPGMAVGVVKNGEVIFAKGFGEKRLGSGEKVDDNTIFSIASVSKHITATALGILVDQGKITWDDKIVQHIPWFQFKDPWITQEVTIRDILTHQTGLGRLLGNRLHFMTNISRDEVLYQVRYMDLEKPFRADYVYNNVMYSLAGQIIEYVDGRTWDDFLKEELFKPLGMNIATTSITEIKPGDNQAYPHQEIDGKVQPIQRRNWDNTGPAAGVNTSVNELNTWMLMQLGEGTYKDQTLVSKEQMKQIQSPQKAMRPSANSKGWRTYGFGWNIMDHEGLQVITHGGATDGFNTSMYLVPDLDLGIVVVGNTFNGFGNAVAYHIMDANIGVSNVDWHERYLQGYKRNYERVSKAREAIHDARIKKTKPSLSLDDYLGVYLSEGYGKVEVKKNGKDLVLHFWDTPGLEATLEHWHFDTFRAVWKNRAQREEFMQFHLGKDGKVVALDFEFVLRPMLLQVGAYPSNYTHTEKFVKE